MQQVEDSLSAVSDRLALRGGQDILEAGSLRGGGGGAKDQRPSHCRPHGLDCGEAANQDRTPLALPQHRSWGSVVVKGNAISGS